MTWQLSMGFFFICSVINVLWQRTYAQKSKLSGKVPPALQYAFGLIPFALIYALFSGNIHITWSTSTIIYLVLEGLFIGLFNWLAFLAYKKTNVAQFETIFQSYALTAALLGWILLHESLTGMQLIGSALLIGGALIAANASQEKKKQSMTSGAVLTFMAATALGIGLVAEKAAIGRMTLSAYFIFGYGTQVIASLAIGARELTQTKKELFTRHELLSCLGIGLLSALGGFFYIYALSKTSNVGLTTIISTFQLPLVVIGGYFILKEKDNVARMALASVVAFAGLLLCSL